MKTKIVVLLILFFGAAGLLFAGGKQETPGRGVDETQGAAETEAAPEPENPRVKLATTTSTDNSGLLAYLLPEFTEDTGYQVDVIAVGTGAALKLGEKGDVDAVLVHARQLEDKFVEEGYGVNRKDVMHNDFVILGPPSDPAGITDADSAADALSMVAETEADFVSRGDNSGTHVKERSLWDKAGVDLAGRWNIKTKQGMGAVITMTNDLEGYTLADRGTFIAMRDKIDLVVQYEGDPSLYNPYGIIAVNPETHPHVNYDGAMALVNWIVSEKAQKLIQSFSKGGDQLFYPDAL